MLPGTPLWACIIYYLIWQLLLVLISLSLLDLLCLTQSLAATGPQRMFAKLKKKKNCNPLSKRHVS